MPNNINKITFLLAILLFSVLKGQTQMEEFYIKMGKIFDNDPALIKLRSSYLLKYQKTKERDQLAFSKLAEIYLYREDTIGNLKRSYEMIGLSKENSELRSRAYLQAAIFLESSSLDLSLNYLKQSVSINEKNQYDFAKTLTYHVLGRNYFKRGEYGKAVYYFNQVFKLAQNSNNYLTASSMYNNIGLVFAKQKKYVQAISYANKSIEVLKNEHVTSTLDVQFLNLVKTNLAEYYYSMKDYQKAKFYWTEAFDFYTKHKVFKRDLEGFIAKYYLVNQDNKGDENAFIEQLKTFLDDNRERPLNIKILEILQNHAIRQGNLSETQKLTTLLSEHYNGYKKIVKNDRAEVVRILNKYMIESLKRERDVEKKEQQLKSLLFFFVLFLLLAGAYYFYRIREVEKKKVYFLKKENRFMQEKTHHLSLNLKLKSQAEKEFYNRVKKIKNTKNKDAEEVIKDLKISFFNLLEIDKRHDSEFVKGFYQDNEFYDLLKKRFPLLNEQERQLCGYLKLKLSAKEISMLQGIIPASVYVYKTNIKNKLGLGKGESLEGFLNNLKN